MSRIELANAKAQPTRTNLGAEVFPSWQQPFPLPERASGVAHPIPACLCWTRNMLPMPHGPFHFLPRTRAEDGVVSGGGEAAKGGGHAGRYREVPSASRATLGSGTRGWRVRFNFHIHDLMEGADTVGCRTSQPIHVLGTFR